MSKKKFSGELALLIAIIYNSINLNLLVHGGFGISTLSSVPYVLSVAFPITSLGTWTIIIQSLTLLVMMVIARRFKIGYILSFFVAILFGYSVDLTAPLIALIPTSLPFRVLCLGVGLVGTAIGAAFFLLCKLPIQPFDLFVREVVDASNKSVHFVRMRYDGVSLTISLVVTLLFIKHLDGIGIGTVLGFLFTGKLSQIFVDFLTSRFEFTQFTKAGAFLEKIS
ncbi:DUF6198 family protein [Erysipelothrix aquatica]|uniref:DUF6198 family protein n=1 Tax=Erysipelothrix aquatica TaxID=2683714 RepID=UPI001358EA87|nr:DUF6198 family protein [Erysipelothrix aquatica]